MKYIIIVAFILKSNLKLLHKNVRAFDRKLIGQKFVYSFLTARYPFAFFGMISVSLCKNYHQILCMSII